MNNITEQEDELFGRWEECIKVREDKNLFVKDGVIDPVQWEKEKVKITFVLKEAVDNPDWKDRDLRRVLKNQEAAEKTRYTWDNIARWTEAILEGKRYPRNLERESRIRLLSRISAMNLKKVAGGKKANPYKIRKFAEDDKGCILEQLKLYKPDIIICCGVCRGKNLADILYESVLTNNDGWKETPIKHEIRRDKVCRYFHAKLGDESKKTLVVSYYHPLLCGEKHYDNLIDLMEKLGINK